LSGSSSRLKREDCTHPKYDHLFSDWKMKNKAKAEKTETRLLNTSNYAWNKGNNGDRRHEKVLQKLKSSKKLSGFQQKKTSVKIGTSKSFSWESNKKTFFKKPHEVRGKRCEVHKSRTTKVSKSSSVFDSRFGNSTYESVSYRSDVKEYYSSICGATSVDGSSCKRPPAEGRKRCWQHTGMWGNTTPVPRNKRCDRHKGKRAAPYYK
jgi:hypothetical protein